MPHSRRRRIFRRPIVIAAISAGVVVTVGAIAVVGVLVTQTVYSVLAQPPKIGTTVIAPQQSKARIALDQIQMSAEATSATQYLASQPTAYWLTPEQDPIGKVGGTVLNLISQGRDQGRATAMVIYGLPDRDCGNQSAGGLSPEDYPTWATEIGNALKTAPDQQKIVVLEPDSIALASECGDVTTRAKYLSGAIDALTSTGTWIYIDGGHSSWRSVDEMADLIRQIGILDRVRGFATNVSNYQPTYDEFAYARALSTRLGGTHAIIDTSRNGVATAGTTWCNPSGQRVGAPGGTFGDDIIDTNLWIKPPGESDGSCGGGPAAGLWWPAAAAELTTGIR